MSDGSNSGFPPPAGFPPAQVPPTAYPLQPGPPQGGHSPTSVQPSKGVPKAVVALISGLVCLVIGGASGYFVGRANSDSLISFDDGNGGEISFGGSDDDTQAASPSSTRESPVPLGEVVEVGNGWSVSVISYDPDATEMLSEMNEFNDPPDSGKRWVVLELEVSNVSGEEPESPFFGLDIGLLGSDNTKRTSMDGFCNAPEPQFSDNAELYRGGSESGNLCLVVGDTEAEDMVLVVSPSFEEENSSFLALR